MKKLHPDGTIKEWPELQDQAGQGWVVSSPHGDAFIECDCGSTSFRVSWWDTPYTGGYGDIECVKCGKRRNLIADYS